MTDLPPFPIEEQIMALFEGAPGAFELTRIGRDYYLDLAEAVVGEATHEWLTEDGHIQDPFEPQDRWQGGTAARFACPAAIAGRQRRHKELVEPACRAIDQVCAKIAAAADTGEPAFPPGVLDLMAKEVLIACHQIAPYAGTIRPRQWYEALSSVRPETAYTLERKIQSQSRATNYEAYAAVAEWIRHCMGLADRRDYVDRSIEVNLPWFTSHGLYRDPNDPCLYDLSVRQNVSELLQYGYDGPWADTLNELTRRGGLTMLLMLSPNGWAPYGGRSNLFVHNEAMVAYVAEFEAKRWRDLGHARIAGAFKHVARRAAMAAEPYLFDVPLRSTKNRFDPSTKYGRDTSYGEYAVYSLLAASLFARAYLVADDSIPEAAAPVGSRGTLLHLYPEFHRTFAACGDTQVQMDTRAQPGHDATGIGRFHRQGVPEALGLSLSIPAKPSFITGEAVPGRAAAIGPAWRGSGGPWETLAECSDDQVAGVECDALEVSDRAVRWRVAHSLSGMAARGVVQTFTLTEGQLHLTVEVDGDPDETAIEVPCLHFDGETQAELVLSGPTGACVRCGGSCLKVAVPGAAALEVDDTLRASRQAIYRVASFQVPGRAAEATLTLR